MQDAEVKKKPRKRSPKKRAPAKKKGTSGARPAENLRLEAQALYLTSVHPISIEEISKDPRFAGKVSSQTLRRWCAEGGWALAREQSMAGVKAQLQDILGRRLQLNTVRRVQDLLTVREMLLSKMAQVPVRSFEGGSKELREINKELAEMAEGYAGGVLDEFGREIPKSAQRSSVVAHGYSPEQLRRLARKIHEEERTELRARLSAGEAQT